MRTKLLASFCFFNLFLLFQVHGQNCISNIVVEQDDCTPFGEYNAFVSFEHSPNVDSVSIFFNGAFFGNHSTEFLPIVLSPIQYVPNGNNTHVIEVVSTTSSACGDSVAFEGICDFGVNDCLSEIFFVDTYCIDSTLQFELEYTFLNPVSEGHIYVNDEFISNAAVGENQSLTFTVGIDPNSVYEVVLRDAEFPSCGDTLTTQVAPCVENCTADFDITTSCNADGTYALSFFHQDTVMTKLYHNDQFISRIVPGQTNNPFIIDGLVIDTSQSSFTLTTCLVTNPSCCRTVTFDQPDCQPCDINLSLNDVFCEGFAPAFNISYDYINPSSTAQFIVNGSIVENANPGQNNTVILNPQILNGQGLYTIILQDTLNPICADTIFITDFFCDDCVVETSNIVTECIAGTDNYLVELDIFNTGSTQVFEYFIVHQTGQTFGPFNTFGANGAIQASFEVSNSLQGQFQVFDTNGICTAFFDTQVDCNPNTDCSITNVLFDITCINTFAFEAFIQFEASNVAGDTVEIIDILGQSYGFFDVNQQPITIQVTNTQGIDVFGVNIINPLDSNCVAESNILGVECGGCQLEATTSFVECLPGSNNYLLGLEVTNFGPTPVFEYMVSHDASGEVFGPFTNTNGSPNTSIQFELSTDLDGNFTVFDPNDAFGSCFAFVFVESDCNLNDCQIESFPEFTECIAGTTNYLLGLNISNTSSTPIFEYNLIHDASGEVFGPFNNPNGASFTFLEIELPINIQGGFTVSSQDSMCTASIIAEADCDTEPDCAISDIVLEYECLDENNYQVFVTFNHTGITGDTVVIRGVSGNILGFYDVNQQPIVIDVNSTSGISNSFGVFIENPLDPECSAGSSLIQVDCSTTEPCEVAFIEILNTECNTDGTYNLSVLYDINIQSAMEITVNVNGVDYDVIPNPNFVFEIEGIAPRPNSDEDIITICSQEFSDCCLVNEYLQPNCMVENECAIQGIEYEPICLDSAGFFMVNLFFAHDNTSGEVVITSFNGLSLGQFDVNQQPISVGPFSADDLDDNGIGFIVCDAQIQSCCAEVFVDNIPCNISNETCEVEFIEIISTDCNPDGTYDLTVGYSTANANNDFIDVVINGGAVQSFTNTGTLTVSGISPRPNSDFDIIEICVNDSPNCCLVNEYLQPDCMVEDECAIQGIEYEPICLDSAGFFMVNLFFTHDNTSGEVVITSFNGLSLGQFDVNQQPISVGPFSADDLDDNGIGFIICDAQIQDCCEEVFADNIPCNISNETCEVEFIEVISTDCNTDGTYNLNATYSIANGENDFVDVTVNGGAVQSLSNSGSVLVTDIAPRSNSDFDIIEICLNDNPNCCEVIEYLQPDCSTSPQECELEILSVDFVCDGNNEEQIFFQLDVQSNSMNSFLVFVNGVELGTGLSSDVITEVGPFPQNADGFYSIQVIDADDATCRAEFELLQAFCPTDCFIGDLEVEIECLDSGFFTAVISFEYDANHQDGVSISGNGTNYGVFDGFNQPIILDSLLSSANGVWEFVVTDAQDDACQAITEIDDIDCTDDNLECIIENIEVFNLECIGDNEYAMSITFETGTNTNAPFSFFVNGEPMNAASTSALPLNVIGVIPNDSSDVDVITICLDDFDGQCCVDFAYEQPDCLSNAVDATLIDAVSMSPNPTSNMLYINDIPNDIKGLHVIDNLGRTIKQITSQPNVALDVSEYQNGIYTIQFFTQDNRIKSRRFVKM